MGTHDEINGAEPQNEFLSGFRIKSREISQGDEAQNVTQPKAGGGIASRKPASEQQNHTASNPYQLTQQINNDKRADYVGKDSVEKKSGTDFVKKIKSKLFHGKSNAEGKRQKIMMVMIPILFVVMVFLFRQVLSKPPQSTEGNTNENDAVAGVNKSSYGEIEWQIPDPLPLKIRNSSASEQNTSDNPGDETITGNIENGIMYVQSILYSNDNPSVVIGNKIIYLNQKVNGAAVVEIHKDYIVFEKDGKRWTQKVAEEIAPEKKDKEVH
ncbi:MAG: hypothetical protein JW787_14395 [Sedimentisphaerales bacterium]|nr:hypothetical protein [Sedimentisphaerales bacterium]